MGKRRCPSCKKLFVPRAIGRRGLTMTCSRSCGARWREFRERGGPPTPGRKGRPRECPTCAATFIPQSGSQRCCSRVCARQFDWTRRKPKERLPQTSGYVWRYVENHPRAVRLNKKMRPHGGYILEHRYVMEQKLGRYLSPRERVHHRNGRRDDNHPENLELWTLDHKDPSGVRATDVPHCPTCTCGRGL